MSESRFTDRVVVVTGGGSGIGAATVDRFGREGATVISVGRSEDKLKRAAAEAAAGSTVVPRVTDVSDEAAVNALIASVVEDFGRLDVLVNNAAIAVPGTVEQLDTASWRQVFDADVDGVFFASRAALPHLRRVGGCIVNVGSVSGLGADWGMAAYNSAKGAVVNLTNAMALDHARDGVRVNAVHPSLTRTSVASFVTDNAEMLGAFEERIAMGRAAEPSEVASVIAFLASEDASFVNGAHIPVDGGLRASSGQPRMF
ncbi:SDR family NAD(P)-dependent oxidoreductase [Streptomyces sp. NPDC087300]|uniref:SDR family NAD(P)-dependent oxidoreductase n=1 Tax=Streptomyces sp. NPDC087300 TaxID=3365780 RepID=UPI0037F6D9F6